MLLETRPDLTDTQPITDTVIATLHAAGLDTRNENALRDGVVLYHIARRIAGPSEPAHRRTKIGRNDPCPCASGKKYKRCCLQADGVAGWAAAPAPLPIPHIWEEDVLFSGTLRLQQLFLLRSDLRDHLPSVEEIDAFLADHPESDFETLGAEALDELGDVFASEYLDDADYDRLDEALIEVGRSLDPRDPDRVVCALGAFLAETPYEQVDILGIVLFRTALAMHGLLLADCRNVSQAIRAVPEGEWSFARCAEQLGSLGRDAADRSFELTVRCTLDGALDALASGDLELDLPLASAILVQREVLPEGDAQAIRDAFERALVALEEGDRQLYGEYLDLWSNDPARPPLERARASLLAALLPSEPSLVWGFAMLAFCRTERVGDVLLPDFEVLAEDEDWYSESALSRYAAYLDARGYPGLARRTEAMSPELQRVFEAAAARSS